MIRGWHRYARLHKSGSVDALRIQTSEAKRLSITWGGHAPHWIEVKRRLCQPKFWPIPVRHTSQIAGMFTRIHRLRFTTTYDLALGTSGRKAVIWAGRIPDWARVILAYDLTRLADEQAGPYR